MLFGRSIFHPDAGKFRSFAGELLFQRAKGNRVGTIESRVGAHRFLPIRPLRQFSFVYLVEFLAGSRATAFRNYSTNKQTGPNHDNLYQSNQIAAGMPLTFEGQSQKSQNCFFDNRDEHGNPRKDLPDNHKGPCVPEDPQK
jgi:hypothetical protein